MNRFREKLARLEAQNSLRRLSAPRGIDLTSNDYLRMRAHERLRQAAFGALEAGIDLGAGGSRLLRGNHPAHENLERYAAAHYGFEKTLYFGSGFLANYALLATLPERGDTVLYDALIHASVRDGLRAGLARTVKIPHNDLDAFESALKAACAESGMTWIAVESVYSMDGDLAPLIELHALARQYGAMLVIDEAHGTGVFGPSGRGLSEDLPRDHVIVLHTCGKAVGVAGGLICAAADIIDTLINRARPFIYSTAPPPLQAFLTQAALEILNAEPWRREKLMGLIQSAKRIFPAHSVASQIIPLIAGGNQAALDQAAFLQAKGFDLRAIRPPSVPENTARLRLSLNIDLDEEALRVLAAALHSFHPKEAS